MIPILEERIVTRTELALMEEVRILRDHSEYHDPQRVTLRREVVAVERFGDDGKLLPSLSLISSRDHLHRNKWIRL